VRLEPTIPAGERPQTYALDREATGTGTGNIRTFYFLRNRIYVSRIILLLSVCSFCNRINQFVLIYTQQNATLHGLFYLETALHVSGGTTTHHQESKQLYLQHMVFVTPLLPPTAIVEE
jgi:hypothetical protein